MAETIHVTFQSTRGARPREGLVPTLISERTSSPASSMLPCTTPTAVFFSAVREGERAGGIEGGREGEREKEGVKDVGRNIAIIMVSC